MNKKLVVRTLKDLQATLDSAKAHQQKCSAQVSAAKQTFFVNKDQPNAEALREANLAFLVASGQVRKAKEAVRVFCYNAKPALTASGHVMRH